MREIQNNLQRIMGLSSNHVDMQRQVDTYTQEERKLVEEFNAQVDQFEDKLKDAAAHKQKLRQEIATLEIELKNLRY